MKQTKQQKAELVEKLGAALKNAASTVFVGFKSMNVADETVMRRELRASGVKYTVVKKTLIRRVLDSLGLASKETQLGGEVALAYGLPKEGEGDDVTAAPRLVHEFGQKFLGKLTILGGIFEGKLVGQSDMLDIATIPSMQALRGMFVNVINSPIQGLAVALSAIAETKSSQ